MNRAFLLISKNLLCAAACAFITGISASSFLPPLLPGFGSIAFAVLAAAFLRFDRKIGATVLIMLFFGSLGALYGSDCRRPPSDPSHIYNRMDMKTEAVVLGTVVSLQASDGEGCRAEINTEAVMIKGEDDLTRTSGRISLNLKGAWPKDILPGDQVLVRAGLNRPSGLQTAGSFNYVQFLAERDIWITGRIDSPLFIHKMPSASFFGHGLRYAAERARMQIGQTIDATLAPQEAGIYRAVLIGDRSGIDSDLQEKFKGSGCMHILAISGLHMSIIGLFLFTIFYWLLRRSPWLILHCDVKKAAAVACVPPLCLYTLLAGSNTPVLRSLIMSLVVIAALCVNRPKSLFATLSMALFCLLVWRPPSVFSVSFQLTFVAVASIAMISPFLTRLLLPDQEQEGPQSLFVRIKNWIIAALAVSVAATLGTTPLLLFSFNRISLIGPLANLILEPLICLWSLSFGFLACPFIFLWPSLASVFLKIGSLGLVVAGKILFDGFPWANLWLPAPSPLLVALYYMSLVALLFARGNLRRLAGAVLMVTLLFFWLPPAELFKGRIRDSRITVIDVGQGSANLLELPGGKRVLIDTGGPSSPRFNVGAQVVGPFLWKKGIVGIDAVIISHPDADHYNGIPFILKHFRPEILWINGSAGHDSGYAELLGLAKKLGVDVRVPTGDEILIRAGGAVISVIENPLSPGSGGQAAPGRDGPAINDAGLVVKFSHGRISALFPGDITKRAEALLVLRPDMLKSTVLLAPHHGSSTSNSAPFLEAVHPELLVVSAGASFGHIFPARDLAQRAAGCGAKMLITARAGCVTVRTDGRTCLLASGNGISLDEAISLSQ